jgi:hypothetical protein
VLPQDALYDSPWLGPNAFLYCPTDGHLASHRSHKLACVFGGPSGPRAIWMGSLRTAKPAVPRGPVDVPQLRGDLGVGHGPFA